MRLSKTEIIEYISNSSQTEKLYLMAMNCGFCNDFPDYKIEDFGIYLEKANINNIKYVDELISENTLHIKEFFTEIYLKRKNGNDWLLNHVFLCKLVLIFKFPEIFQLEYLVDNGWDEDIARIVLNATKKLKQI